MNELVNYVKNFFFFKYFFINVIIKKQKQFEEESLKNENIRTNFPLFRSPLSTCIEKNIEENERAKIRQKTSSFNTVQNSKNYAKIPMEDELESLKTDSHKDSSEEKSKSGGKIDINCLQMRSKKM